MIDILLLGTGAMSPLPKRHLSSIILRHAGEQVLIDCGEGTQVAIKKYGFGFKSISGIALTHFHGDHIFGLPGLLHAMMQAGREEPVWISGPEGLEEVLQAIHLLIGDLTFPLHLMKENSFESCGLKIQSFPLAHRVPAQGYRFELERRGKFLRDRAEELGIPVEYWSTLKEGNEVAGFTPLQVLGPKRKSILVTIAQDSAPCEKIVENGKDADLLVLEGTYAVDEKNAAKEYGHMTFAQAAELASRSQAKELWLTHFSPSISDPKEHISLVREIFPNTHIGVDGMHKTLTFEE